MTTPVRFLFVLTTFLLLGFSALADCTSPAGTLAKIEFNTTKKTFEYCDGTNWIDMTRGGSPTPLATFSDSTPRIGSPNGVAIYGNYAYIANPNAKSIAVLDVTDIENPVILTHLVDTTLFSSPKDLYISGTYLYVTSGNRLVIVSLAAPATPTVVGSLLDNTTLQNANQVFVSGGYAFVTKYQGLTIINVSTPSAPTNVGTLTSATFLNGAEGLSISGNYAYVAAKSVNRLTVIDVTTKSSPAIVGSVQSNTNYLYGAWGVYVSGNYAYVTANYGDDLAVVDISTPSSPTIVGGILADDVTGTGWDGPSDICVSGNSLLIVNDGSNRSAAFITTVDISTPTAPAQMSFVRQSYDLLKHCAVNGSKFLATSNNLGSIYSATVATGKFLSNVVASSIVEPSSDGGLSAAISGNYLFTPAEKSGSNNNVGGYLIAYNISTPASMSYAGKLSHNDLYKCDGIAISGSYAYVLCQSRLVVVNISTPSSPAYVTTLNDTTNLDDAKKIAISGSYAYITTGSAKRFTVVNISNPNSPFVAASLLDSTKFDNTCSRPSGHFCGDLTISGNYAYVPAFANNSLTIVDISTPTSPSVVGSIQDATNLQWPTSVKVSGNYAFVGAKGGTRLTSINISTPSSPTYTGTYTGVTPGGLVISGNYAFVANTYNPGALTVINISNPASMSYAGGSSGNQYIPISIVQSGNHVFVVDYLYVASYDVSTPTSPVYKTKSFFNSPTGDVVSLDVSSSENYAYIVGAANTSAGTGGKLTVVDITNKSAPTVASFLPDTTNLKVPIALDESTGYTYIIDEYFDSLVIYNTTNPAAPTYSGKYTNAVSNDRPTAVIVSGNYAYVLACNSDRLNIIDVTNKASPSLAGSVQDAVNLDCPDRLSISGNTAYVTSSGSKSVTLVDITNKSAPSVIGSVIDTLKINSASGAFISGNYAYVQGYNNSTFAHEIYGINISTPSSPSIESSFKPYPSTEYSKKFEPVSATSAVKSHYRGLNQFIFNGPNNILMTANIDNSVCGAYSNNGGSGKSNISMLTNHAITNVEQSDALCLLRAITGPAVTSLKVTADVPRLNSGMGSIAISGNYLFTVSNQRAFTTLDISNPLSPVISGFAYLSQLQDPRGLSVSGNYAYVAGYSTSSVSIVDISTPTAPNVISTYTTVNNPADLFSTGGYTYTISTFYDSLQIANVSNPLAVTSSASFATLPNVDGPSSIFVSGNYAYITGSTSDSLGIVDVTNKSSPAYAGSITHATNLDYPQTVTVAGNYAYVGGPNYLSIVDVTNKSAPSLMSYLALSASPSRIAISGTTAYIVTGMGAHMVDVSDPMAPTILASDATFSYAIDLAGNYGFGTGSGTINIFDATPPVTDGSCTTEGQMDYNSTNNLLRYCNGATWKGMGPKPGAGGAGCTTPTAVKGALDFYSTTNKYRFCDGSAWITID